MEQTVGDDFHRKSGSWMKLYRLIDRVKDWYHERVTDPAIGKVVHECREALTKHRGHGSARAKDEAPTVAFTRRRDSARNVSRARV